MEEQNSYPAESQENYLDYFQGVRLAFRARSENLIFHLKSEPADLSRKVSSKTAYEQVIRGYSDILSNKEILHPKVYERQPFANKIFETQKLFIHISEEPMDEAAVGVRPHGLSIYYDSKKRIHTTLRWRVSDRSLFTRLVMAITCGKPQTFVIILDKKDDYFSKSAEDLTVALPSYLGVKGLTFTQL